MSQIVCSVCGKGGHSSSRCKELGIPPDGFYRPLGGAHHHDDDEGETIIHLSEILYSYRKWYNRVLRERQLKQMKKEQPAVPLKTVKTC